MHVLPRAECQKKDPRTVIERGNIAIGVMNTVFPIATKTLNPKPSSTASRTLMSPLVRIWLWVCYNKVPIDPTFYLLKGTINHEP